MPIADDLQEIAARANRDLGSVRDFLEHSIIVWRSFRNFVDAGHTVRSTSISTGTTIDQSGLVSLTTQ